MDREFEGLGFSPADILLPAGADMTKWAVVACDQFTSEPAYWEEVRRIAGDAPSAAKLILPESELGREDVDDRIRGINRTMGQYLGEGVFSCREDALIYVERTQSDGTVRHGLVGKVDLSCYDYTPGSGALIRATEGTVLERIPPRVKVRTDAPIELPHIMLLIDDPEKEVIEPLAGCTEGMECLYDFELMQGGGRVKGWLLRPEQKTAVAASLRKLCDPAVQEEKYGIQGAAPLLFAVGDGNHSLATAKQCYENLKERMTPEELAAHPARYCLVELVNNHDDALVFEPIHRVVFDVDPAQLIEELKRECGAIDGEGRGHVIRWLYGNREGVMTVPHPTVQLPVGTLQSFLDRYLASHGGFVDYIHGEEAVKRLAREPGRVGFLLPAMGKEQLFKTVMADGVLPRKTFSMGNAEDKRYYVEARRIR